ncbi:hypothetical protein J2D73_04795 [Acetobacter sacchari]|uniref:Tetratricopeptide repeat protein n=1 Tax=Acetobacter sacchari TaxID=2661687 RepID=A0ABS3LT75_9PROT|nr:hypothetical protein [Acetobacter sacchari]MBO1359114.1 hypothetical protein [Acetobacter sacchari]
MILTGDYNDLFSSAEEMLKDGDYEEACEVFHELTKRNPDDSGAWIQYISVLNRLRHYKKVDEVFEKCLSLFPDDSWYILGWSRIPDAVADWAESVRRRERMLGLFDVSKKSELLPLIHEQFLPLKYCGRFDELLSLVNKYEDVLLSAKVDPAQIFYGYEVAGLYSLRAKFCENFSRWVDPNDPVFDQRNIANMRLIADEAVLNHAWVKKYASHMRVLSLGQLCLPYNILGRWGLNRCVGMHNAMTPFDLGITNQDLLADAICTKFGAYLNRDNYYERPDQYGAPQLWNRYLGIYFGHERGRSLLGSNYDLFFEGMQSKIDAFYSAVNEGPCLFVYAIAGPCSPNKIIDAMVPYLKDGRSRMLMLNLTREKFSVKLNSQHVRYVDVPYPVDYAWNEPLGFASERGFAFESKVVSEVKHEMLKIL